MFQIEESDYSLIAKSKCVLYEIDRKTYQRILKITSEKRLKKYVDIFDKRELFDTLSKSEKLKMAECLRK